MYLLQPNLDCYEDQTDSIGWWESRNYSLNEARGIVFYQQIDCSLKRALETEKERNRSIGYQK